MDGVKFELLTEQFDAFLAELAAIDPAIEFKTIIEQVAIRVVQGAMTRTHAAKVGSIRADHAAREWITLDGKKYRIAGTGRYGRQKKAHGNYYPGGVWGKIIAKRKTDLAARLASRGMAKQSWLQLSRALGQEITVPGYVSGANYKGRTYPSDGTINEEGDGTKYVLTLINSSPLVQYAGGYGALIAAMYGEIGYFRNNMAHKFYLTAASRASKYPGIFATET